MASNLFPVLDLAGTDMRKYIGLSSNLPFLSYTMMGSVPFATAQTFSRMVVLPALALPMTRMQKRGHLYCSLSCVISFAFISAQALSNSEGHETNYSLDADELEISAITIYSLGKIYGLYD